MTPLHTAAMRGYYGVVKTILESDKSVYCNAIDMFGRTPMYLAASNGHVGVVMLMGKFECSTVIGSDVDGTSPLDESVSRGFRGTSQYLYKIHSQNKKDAIGDTLLHKAALSRYNYDFIDTSVYEGNYYKQYPLHYTGLVGNISMAKVLCQLIFLFQKDIDLYDKYGNTALHFAAMNGHESVVFLLLKYGANKYSKNIFGDTPEDLAVKNKFSSIVKLLCNDAVV
eukprot:GHVR01037354.1.p1 GENE.GHVR01037354.1~~GHVR01037354.1.p1  ORF type:complete len:225 (-),score=33.20 GHVR01037354.1:47-721(-)